MDILLITDGEVWGHEAIINAAKKSGHRVFTVGVGNAVSEAFVRGIAQATAGACELVSPREDMAGRIVRHFQRIDQPMARSVEVIWPADPLRQIPQRVEGVYAGDTLHVFGWHTTAPQGEVTLKITFEDGQTACQSVAISREPISGNDSSASLVRMAAYHRLGALRESEATELALRYRLVTEHTSYVLVFDREDAERSEELPALRKVPQLLAAGWGGVGTVSDSIVCDMMPSIMSTPALLGPESAGFELLIKNLNDRYPEAISARLDIETLAQLLELGLSREDAAVLSGLIGSKATEQEVVLAFLVFLSGSEFGRGLSRHVERLIRTACRKRGHDDALVAEVERLLTPRHMNERHSPFVGDFFD